MNNKIFGEAVLVLVLVVTLSFFAAAAGFANGDPGASSTSSTSSTSSGGSSGTGGTVGGSGYTYPVYEDEFKAGYSKYLVVQDRFRISIDGVYHYIKLIELTSITAKINVTSEPQIATLAVGDSRKFELTNDSYYDLLVTLNDINTTTFGKANFTILSINEVVTAESEQEEQEKEEDAQKQADGAGDSGDSSDDGAGGLTWLVIVIIVIVAGAVGFVIYKMKGQKRKKKYGY